jgi:small subunit ribosomal protein S3Ae
MAIGKNKKTGKGKKGKHKKGDPFLKKEWYDVRTPAMTSFQVKSIGRTIATKTMGIKIARDTLMNRIFEVSLGDLKKDAEDDAFRKFKLRVEDVQGYNCLTNFWGMDLTTDKLRSLVRKWQSLIEAHVDVRTVDGYALRLFCIGFTRRHNQQVRKTSYAQSGQVRAIRRRMVEIMQREATGCDLSQLVEKLTNETIGKEIEKHTQAIYPLQNVLIRKAKMLRSPKLDTTKLVEAAGGKDELAKQSAGTGPAQQVAAAAHAAAAAAAAKLAGAVVVSAAPADTGVAVDAKKSDAKSAAPAAAAAGTTAAAAPAAPAAAPKKADASKQAKAAPAAGAAGGKKDNKKQGKAAGNA